MTRDSAFNRILGISPYLEVVIRSIYWRSNFLIEYKNKRDSNAKEKIKNSRPTPFPLIMQKLRDRGINEGDLLIVHSSFDSLKKTDSNPKEIIESLLNLLGESGTLGMPTTPLFKGALTGKAIIAQDVSELILDYNPKKTIASTGLLPNIFLRFPGVIRSQHPLNTLAAVGPLAKQMMEKNLLGDKPLPCGVNSSWKFCVDHNAKIVALGVDLAHSLTMVHVAEDMNPEQWPVKGWYRERKFRIIESSNINEIVVRERHPKWSMYYAERTLYKDLIRAGLMTSDSINGIKVEIVDDSKKLIDFLEEKSKTGYPCFFLRHK